MARKVYNFVCGVSDAKPPKLTKKEKEELRQKATSIEENKLWSKICDINAVIAIAVTCLIIGFYA